MTTSMDNQEKTMNNSLSMDGIFFNDIPDQYVRGENITLTFSASKDIEIDPDKDVVGLIKIGSTSLTECLAYGKIELERSGMLSSGKATFFSSELPGCDEEFYQFCYIQNKEKLRGTSVPFQLNCSPDDIDLLSSNMSLSMLDRSERDNARLNTLFEFPDNENEDLVVIQTKRMLTEEKLRQENRQLYEFNQTLVKENDLYKLKFDEYISKVQQEMETLKASHKTAINELSARQQLETKVRTEYEATLKLCGQYQKDALEKAERYRDLEESHCELQVEARRLENELTLAVENVKQQTKKLEELESKLEQTKQSLKLAEESRLQNEQRLRDLCSTSDKFQRTTQMKIEALNKQSEQQENQIHALQMANSLLKEELKSVRDENLILTQRIQQEKSIVNQFQQDREQAEKLRQNFEQMKIQQEEYQTLVSSVAEIKNRCIKHQKGEIEVKKQLTAYKEHVKGLENEIQELRERLTVGSEEYKTVYRKLHAAEQLLKKFKTPAPQQNPTSLSNETGLNEEALVSLLQNSYQLQQREQLNIQREEEKRQEPAPIPHVEVEIRECPMCYWEFPRHMTLEDKKQHIDAHFD